MERIILHVYNMFWIYRTQGYINRTFMVGWKWSMYISQYVCEPILRSQSIDEKSLLNSFWSTLGKTHPALFHHSLRQLTTLSLLFIILYQHFWYSFHTWWTCGWWDYLCCWFMISVIFSWLWPELEEMHEQSIKLFYFLLTVLVDSHGFFAGYFCCLIVRYTLDLTQFLNWSMNLINLTP